MKSNKIIIVTMLLLFVALFGVLFMGPANIVKARTARDLLVEALNQIETPEPGQIMHYTYQRYNRPPPASLEPNDPYHLPFNETWQSQEIGHVWLQLGPEGKQTIRWRNQLLHPEGDLLQDLMFDGTTETDYFPTEGRATRYPMEASSFRDNRIALIEDFLQNEELSRQENRGIDGQAVLSVYGESINLANDSALTVAEALLNFNRPFMADLDAVNLVKRIDFDPATNLPVGEGDVIFDKTGAEHIIRYYTFSTPEIITKETAEAEKIFQQDIPADAFNQSSSIPILKQVVGLDEIIKQVSYPIYAAPAITKPVSLASASVVVPIPDYSPPKDLQGIEFADAIGTGVSTIYTDEDQKISVKIIQGPTADIGNTLRQTKPTWVQADQLQLWLGAEQVTAWELIDLDSETVRYIIELADTILYVQSRGLSSEQLQELFKEFTLIE